MKKKSITEIERPIFVLGAARSGSSILALGLTQGIGFPGFNESQVFPLLDQLLGTVTTYFGQLGSDYTLQTDVHLIARVTEQGLQDRIVELFDNLHRDVYQAPIWVDKTPTSSMLQSVPLLQRIYPKARFVFAKRRGIENILSRQRKFPQEPFEAHCAEWSACMQAWREVQPLIASQSIEIDQRDIALTPEETAADLADFLDLSEEQTRQMSTFWRQQRPEQTAPAQDHKYTALHDTGWSAQRISCFVETCRPMMEEYGYSLSGQTEVTVGTLRDLWLCFPVTQLSNVDLGDTSPEAFTAQPGGFMLHPNTPDGKMTTIRYRGLKFAGHTSFRATLKLGNPRSAPVIFTVTVSDASGKNAIVSQSTELTAESIDDWHFEFPSLHGPHRVTIQTAMAQGAQNNHGAWAVWINPRFSAD